MCGPDNSNRPRGGALAVLNPPTGDVHPCSNTARALQGDLSFHTPGDPSSSTATHARWTCDSSSEAQSLDDLVFVIHQTGDLTLDPSLCGQFREIPFAKASPLDGTGRARETTLQLPVSLEVGNDGIIGRRVSLYHANEGKRKDALAEGIVGFNFARPTTASL